MEENVVNALELEYEQISAHNLEQNFFIRIALGGELKRQKRVEQALTRSNDIFNLVFDKKEIWVRLILWNLKFQETHDKLISCGFRFEENDGVLEVNNPINLNNAQLEDAKVYYIHYNEFDFEKIKPLLSAIFSFELAIQPSADISAVFLNTQDSLTLINPYDDRGLNIITTDALSFNKIEETFKKWAL